jgi:outer membrane protein TolC
MKKLYFPILLIPLLIVSIGEAQRLTLEQAITRALEASDVLHSSREDVKVAELQARQASAQRLPQLDFSGSYVYTSRVMSIHNSPIVIPLEMGQSLTLPGQDIQFGDHHNADFKVQVTQPLFMGFKLQRAYRAANQVVEVRRAERELTALNVRIQTEQNYINLQRTGAILEMSRLQVQTLERHLEDARARVRAGVALAEFASRAEYALSQAQLALQQAEQNHRLAQLNLIEQLKLPPDAALELDSLEFMPGDTAGRDLEFAEAHRAEFRSLEAQAGASDERIGVQKGSFYPTLSAFGAVDYGRPGVDVIKNDWMLYERAGASLSWTLWDWGIRKNKVQEIQAARRQLDDARSQLESQVRLQIASAKLALSTAQQRIKVTEQGRKLAQDILDWVQNRYLQGVATETEYQDAQSDNLASRINAIVALADYRLARVALIAALGGESAQP